MGLGVSGVGVAGAPSFRAATWPLLQPVCCGVWLEFPSLSKER